ncbi:MAG: tetR-family transcriptional regulator [Frankiales bacterium]|nr:tetR-family transcriptional regulator [Frankiales bacterium]
MTLPLPDRSARREALLEAADRIVQRDGPAVSMASIAAEAGITKPILYRHFGDKGGLYAALAERHTDRLLAALQDALAGAGTPRARVERTVRTYLATIEEEPQVYRFLVHSAEGEAASAHGQVRSFLRRLSELLAVGIAAELGLPAGAFRAEIWARGIVGMVQAAGDWWLLEGGADREELVGELTDLLWGAYAEGVRRSSRGGGD